MADREAIRLTMILISQNGYNDMKIHEHRMDQWYTVIHKWLSQSWALLDHGFINLYALRLGNLQDMPFCLALQGKGGFHLFFAKKSKGIHWWKWDKWKFPAVSKLFAGMIQYLKASWSHGMAPQNRYYIYTVYIPLLIIIILMLISHFFRVTWVKTWQLKTGQWMTMSASDVLRAWQLPSWQPKSWLIVPWQPELLTRKPVGVASLFIPLFTGF